MPYKILQILTSETRCNCKKAKPVNVKFDNGDDWIVSHRSWALVAVSILCFWLNISASASVPPNLKYSGPSAIARGSMKLKLKWRRLSNNIVRFRLYVKFRPHQFDLAVRVSKLMLRNLCGTRRIGALVWMNTLKLNATVKYDSTRSANMIDYFEHIRWLPYALN